MNYRHIYHAGNFADVFKHITLCLILRYLQRKPAAFRLLDTHAGSGLYDLQAEAAGKTAEWQSGIARFLTCLAPDLTEKLGDYARITAQNEACALLAPYLGALAELNSGGRLRLYPGSPALARRLFRKQDRLTATELHSEEFAQLKQHFTGDYQSRILHLDGRLALKAQLPPKEKRGLVLVDPPFERTDEFAAMAAGMAEAMARFPYGSYMLWYPVKDYAAIARFGAALGETCKGSLLQAELHIRARGAEPRLNGSGLMLINPPYILAEQLKMLEPLFLRAFAQDKAACLRLNWLRRE